VVYEFISRQNILSLRITTGISSNVKANGDAEDEVVYGQTVYGTETRQLTATTAFAEEREN
jgi:hypothetical protein